jgi:CheY-like chemotaxis protein
MDEKTNLKTVYVVDDDEDIRDIISLVLEEAGYRVLTSDGGLALHRMIRTGPKPDLVLMDLMMPCVDGECWLKTIRQRPEWRGVPVVICSCRNLSTKEARRLGADDFLPKPMDLAKLYALVAKMLAPHPVTPVWTPLLRVASAVALALPWR